jgi:hypothetical protein
VLPLLQRRGQRNCTLALVDGGNDDREREGLTCHVSSLFKFENEHAFACEKFHGRPQPRKECLRHIHMRACRPAAAAARP